MRKAASGTLAHERLRAPSGSTVADIDEIWEYISQENIDAADRIIDDIFTAPRALVASPHIGHRRSDLTARPLRFHAVRDQYLIAYAPDERPLWVVAVLPVVTRA